MKELDFKKWLETATSTACVANFARPLAPMQPVQSKKKKKS